MSDDIAVDESTVELLSARYLGSQAELRAKRVSFNMSKRSATKLGQSVALVSFIMLVTSSFFLVLGARYIVK